METNDNTVIGVIKKQEDHKILQDCQDMASYLVTCENGYCFEQPNEEGCNGLHELVSDYGSVAHGGSNKKEAYSFALEDFNSYKAEVCEGFVRGNCEWCCE